MTPTPGLHRVERNAPREYGLATKVTGRNLAAVTYIIALEAERTETELVFSAGFGNDGSLLGCVVREAQTKNEVHIAPGEYLVLRPGHNGAVVLLTETDYSRWYRPVD